MIKDNDSEERLAGGNRTRQLSDEIDDGKLKPTTQQEALVVAQDLTDEVADRESPIAKLKTMPKLGSTSPQSSKGDSERSSSETNLEQKTNEPSYTTDVSMLLQRQQTANSLALGAGGGATSSALIRSLLAGGGSPGLNSGAHQQQSNLGRAVAHPSMAGADHAQSIHELELRRQQLMLAASLGSGSSLARNPLQSAGYGNAAIEAGALQQQLQRQLFLRRQLASGNESIGGSLGGFNHQQQHQQQQQHNIQSALLHSLGLQGRGGLGGRASALNAATMMYEQQLQHQQQQQQQESQMALIREHLLRSSASSLPSPNANRNLNAAAASLLAGGPDELLSGNAGVTGLSSSSASMGIPRSRGGSGAPAALLREQGLTGPEDVTSLSESFPVKLHRLLLDLELQDAGTDIASFLPNGIAFAVHDPTRFETEVMRKYFPRMNRFASFQRQLNLYDYRRITDGPARGAYYHPSFNRDFPVLCRGMKRTKIKGQIKSESPS